MAVNSVKFGSVLAALAVVVGCAGEAADGSPQAVDAAYAELAQAVAACGKELGSCTSAAHGDVALASTCRDDFEACRAATADEVAALASAAKPCAEQASTCFASVDGGVQAQSCRDELRSCLGVGGDHVKPDQAMPVLPDAAMGGRGGPEGDGFDGDGMGHGGTLPDAAVAAMASRPDGGMPADLPAADVPQAACVGGILECIQNGDDVSVCAMEVRACVLAGLPAAAMGQAGANSAHAAVPRGMPDAGMGHGPPDASLPPRGPRN